MGKLLSAFCTDKRGETREEAVDLGAQLTTNGIIPLLGYSKEVTNTIADIQHTETETIHCIEAASSLKKPVFVAIKLSGLSFEDEMRQLEQEIHCLVSSRPTKPVLLAGSREILSHYPDLVRRLQRISIAAERFDVNLVVDAEIRFQGQVDSLPTSAILCWSLNSSKAHVWNTHQMYSSPSFVSNEGRIFRDSLPMLQQWCGTNSIKLVRGAYFNREPPEIVARSKAEVDETYDRAVEDLITNRSNSLIIASHNHTTVVKAFQLLQGNRTAISRSNRKICFAQLYGMGDDITYGLVRGLGRSTHPFSPNVSVVKYIPYGGLRDVMPYLVRRAEENRDMLRGSMLEREAYYAEIRRRTLSFLGLGLNRD